MSEENRALFAVQYVPIQGAMFAICDVRMIEPDRAEPIIHASSSLHDFCFPVQSPKDRSEAGVVAESVLIAS